MRSAIDVNIGASSGATLMTTATPGFDGSVQKSTSLRFWQATRKTRLKTKQKNDRYLIIQLCTTIRLRKNKTVRELVDTNVSYIRKASEDPHVHVSLRKDADDFVAIVPDLLAGGEYAQKAQQDERSTLHPDIYVVGYLFIYLFILFIFFYQHVRWWTKLNHEHAIRS